jgi:hypothetical protein
MGPFLRCKKDVNMTLAGYSENYDQNNESG